MVNTGLWIIQALLSFLITDGVSGREISYIIDTHTKDVKDADSDATIKIQIHGWTGKTDYFLLDSPENDFYRGVGTKYMVWKEDIGTISKIKLYNKGDGQGPGWCIQFIYVIDMERRMKYHTDLRDNCWLEGEQTREITISHFVRISTTVYKIEVKTYEESQGGTDDYIYMILRSKTGQNTFWSILDSPVNDFEQGEINYFHLEIDDIGSIIKNFTLHNSGTHWNIFDSGWCVQYVIVHDRTRLRSFNFKMHDQGCWIERKKYRTSVLHTYTAIKKSNYRVTTKTENCGSCSSSAYIYISLIGTDGETIRFLLNPADNAFHKNTRAYFNLDTEVIGTITHIELYNDGYGSNPNWCFMEIRILLYGDTDEYQFTPTSCWLNENAIRKIAVSSKVATTTTSTNAAYTTTARTTTKPTVMTTAKPKAITTAKPTAMTAAKLTAITTEKPSAMTTAKPTAHTTPNPVETVTAMLNEERAEKEKVGDSNQMDATDKTEKKLTYTSAVQSGLKVEVVTNLLSFVMGLLFDMFFLG